MAATFKDPLTPNPNRLYDPIPAALSTMCQFIPQTARKDMTPKERIAFRYEWSTFEQIWMYNYTVSTLGGQGAIPIQNIQPYQFLNKNEKLAYINGQAEHIAYYSTAALTGVFNDIRF
jgi:hypothetical protein